MKSKGPVGHLKRKAKQIKKTHPPISLMQVQHDLAKHLGFKKWGELIKTSDSDIQKRIDKNPIERL